MKICLVGSLPVELGGKVKGGIASHIGELAKHLTLKQHQVVLFANDVNHNVADNVISYDSQYEKIKCAVLGLLKFGLVSDTHYTFKQKIKILSDAYKLNTLSCQGLDVFHVHSLHNLAAKACEIAKINYVVSDHGFWQKSTPEGYVANNIKAANKIISISNISRDSILQLSVDSERVTKINNPIASIEYSKKVTDSVFRVYFNGISDGWHRKGLSYISAVLPSILEIENIELTIVTDDASLEQLRNENPDLASYNNLKTSPVLTREENLQRLADSDLFLSPSLSEGFSIAYLESVMLGVPVLGFKSNVDEINDLLNIDFCVPFEHDIDNLVDKILYMKNRDKISGIDTGIFTWDSNINKYIFEYQNCIR